MGFITDTVKAVIGGNAAKKASRQQQKAYADAIAEQRRQYDTSRADSLPFIQSGQSAIAAQTDLAGLNGADKQRSAIQQLQDSPEFQALSQAGQDAILASASATGGLRGGNTIDDLARFRMDALSQIIQQQYARLGQIVAPGQNTTVNLAGIGQRNAEAIGGLRVGQGEAQVGGTLAQGRMWQNIIQAAEQAAGRAVSAGLGGGGAFSNIISTLGKGI